MKKRRFDWDAEAPEDAVRATVLLITAVAGEDWANYWAWDRTTMPTGRPSWRHLWDGLRWWKPPRRKR